MSIRTILVHLDDGPRTRDRVATAAALARRHDAHLIGLAPTGWITIPVDGATALGLATYEEAATRLLRDRAQRCVDDFVTQVRQLGVQAHETRIETGDAGSAMAVAARHADLTVVTQVDPDDRRDVQAPQMPQEVLLQSGRPLLVLPYAGPCALPERPRVLVGWDASREAARAMHDALPLLRAASAVEIVVFDTPRDVDLRHGPLPGADIGLWLTRHGVKVDVRHVPVDVATGEALLSHAADLSAELIVAGGYGHSRLREAVLGGVTRTLMQTSPVPVLLSH
jgi:nucleotide-binding universal stress UspA family protein